MSGCTSKRTISRSAKRVCSICEVLRRSSELRFERDLLLAEMLQRDSQQIAQPHQHAIGRRDVLVHQRRDRVQRVEEEVRMQLLLQRLQLRFDEPGLELRRAQGAVARLAVVEQRVAQADDRPVGHHLPVEIQDGGALDLRSTTRRLAPFGYAQPPVHASMPAMWASEKSTTAGRWTASAAQQPAALDLEVLRQPDDRRGHQRPDVPPREVEDDEGRRDGVGHLPTSRVNCQASVVDSSPSAVATRTTWRQRTPYRGRSATGMSRAGALNVEQPVRWRFHGP